MTNQPIDDLPKLSVSNAVGASRVVRVISPAPEDLWREVLTHDPGATALQKPEYQRAVVSGRGGSDASRLYVLADGRRLLLPLVRARGVIGMAASAGYPAGFGHASMLATGGLRASDVRAVVLDVRASGLCTRIGGGHHTADAWSAGLGPGVDEERRRVDVVDLSVGWDRYLGSVVDRAVRQNLRKAERRGVEIECDTTGRLIPVFYDLYRSWVERWTHRSGLPPVLARWSARRQEPYAKFETVAAQLGDACRVFVAWHKGRAIAGCITLVHGDHGIGWRGYSIKELAGPVGANTAVQIEGLRDAARSGCRFFDLGQSGDATNLQHYKSTLGAAPRRVVDLRIEPPTITGLRATGESGKQLARQTLTKVGELRLSAPRP